MLHLRKDRDALLFRHCLKRLNDPETVYALASCQKPLSDMPESACTEFRDYADQTDSTWFRFTHGKNATDEKVDDAMLEQLLTLTASNDGSLSQSGSCHIALRRQNAEGLADIVVMPTSFLFRKAFKKAYGSDDLTAYNAEELFEKILTTRARMVTG